MRTLLLLLAAAQAIVQPPVNIGPVLRDEGAIVAPIHTLDVTGSATCTVSLGVGSCAVSSGGSGNATEVSLTIEPVRDLQGYAAVPVLPEALAFSPGIAWSPDLHMFAAMVGLTGHTIYISSDGSQWGAITGQFVTPNGQFPRDMIWTGSRFVGVSNGRPSGTPVGAGTSYTSTDGLTWTATENPIPAQGLKFEAVAWAPSLSLMVVVGNGSSLGGGGTVRAYNSADGVTFATSTIENRGWLDVTWSPALGMFVAVCDALAGGNDIAWSTDGLTFTSVDATATGNAWNSVAWSEDLGLFVAVAGSGDLLTSTDGTTWDDSSFLPVTVTAVWNTVEWVDALDIFVALGSNGTRATSPDGTTWTLLTNDFIDQPAFQALAYSSSLNRFVLAATDGAHYFGRMAPPGSAFSVVVTGQSWVTSSSNVLCQPFGTTADNVTPETVVAAALDASVSDRVVGVGFTLNVFSPHGATGTFRFHCVGA